MKTLSARQFDEIKHKFLGFDGEWLRFLGNMPASFVGVVCGEPGSGKSEWCIQLAKYLIGFDRVSWIDYEQGHGPDLQMAMRRNEMHKEVGKWFPVNPLKNRKGGNYLDELDDYLKKRSTPKFVFLNSLSYLTITPEEYKDVLKPYAEKKGLIFIDHSKNGKPQSKAGRYIEGDGQFSVYIKRCIAYSEKNRVGGRGEYIIWEEEARLRNPLYFKKLEGSAGSL